MRKSSLFVVLLLTVMLLLLVFVAYVWLSVPSVPVVVLPNPNGYARFLESGRKIVGTPEDISAADAEALRQYVAENAAALSAIRGGLSLDSVVPVEYTAAYLQQAIDDVGPIKTAGRLLWADARVAELDGNADEAAEKYAELIRLSRKISNGGLLVHVQSGVAYERVGWEAIEKLAPGLSKERKAALRQEFAAMNRSAAMIEECMQRELALASVSQGKFRVFMMSRGRDSNGQHTALLIDEMERARERIVKALSE